MNLFSLTRLNSIDKSFCISCINCEKLLIILIYTTWRSKILFLCCKQALICDRKTARCIGKQSEPEGAGMKTYYAQFDLSLTASPLLVLYCMRAWSQAIVFLNHILLLIPYTFLHYQEEKIEYSFLLRLKRLHVELVSWVPAWIK